MNVISIVSRLNKKLELKVYQGHFATRNSHNSHYIDITRLKHEHILARETAIVLAQRYAYTSPVDTIVCMDGSEVIGAFLARHLSQKDRFNINEDKNINVITPEFDHTGQMIFRDNMVPMVAGKNVLMLISTVKSGKTIGQALNCVKYYQANVQGIASIFSTVEELNGLPVYSIFAPADIPGYTICDPKNCSMCKAGQKVDALANSYGLSML